MCQQFVCTLGLQLLPCELDIEDMLVMLFWRPLFDKKYLPYELNRFDLKENLTIKIWFQTSFLQSIEISALVG